MQVLSEYRSVVAEKLNSVQQRIREAARRSQRCPEDITLVAVTKYVSARDPFIPALLELGMTTFGENRLPILLEKQSVFGPGVSLPEGSSVPQWHLIGSLQRNKIRKVLPFVTLIHSIDSERLLEAVDRIAGEEEIQRQRASFGLSVSVPVLLEVNIGGEESKHGFTPEELETVLPQLLVYKNVQIRGLMGMGRLDGDEKEIRREFCSLKELLLKIRKYATDIHSLRELSMGMSGDFEWAVEQGATFVRIGSLLYP